MTRQRREGGEVQQRPAGRRIPQKMPRPAPVSSTKSRLTPQSLLSTLPATFIKSS